ncbi:MAG: hypothetical protein PHF18_05560 [Methanosarcina sp.]|nr:hypothetical protein [Methanosarcina sp.]
MKLAQDLELNFKEVPPQIKKTLNYRKPLKTMGDIYSLEITQLLEIFYAGKYFSWKK